MKNILAIFLLITGITQAQNLNIPDPILKAHLVRMADANNDGEISYWEGQTITELVIIDMGITSLVGIESFQNLRRLICSYNQITTPLNFYNMYSLETLDCNNNLIPSIDVTGLTNLKSIYATHNQITSLDVSTVNSLETLACSNNPIASLTLNTSLKGLSCSDTNITHLDITGFPNLQSVLAHSNPMLTTANASGVTTLTHFSAYNCPALEWLDVSNTQIPSLNLNGDASLSHLDVDNCTLITHLWIPDAQLTTLDVSGLISLQELKCQNNSIITLDISGCVALKTAWIHNNKIENLNFSDSPLLETALTAGNRFPFLDLSNRPLLTTFNCGNNPNLHTLSIENCTGLTNIGCDYSPMLTSFNIQGCINATNLGAQHTGLTSLNASDLPLLTNVNISYNSQLTSIDLTNTTNIVYLQLRQSNFSELDISTLTALTYLDCQGNSLTTLDASLNTELTTLRCNNNALETLFVKNGVDEQVTLYGNNNLRYVCVDESQKQAVIDAMTSSQNASVNSYCQREPGGDYNTITGKVSLDLNGDGCDENENISQFVKIKVTDGSNDSYVFTDASATYSHYVGIGNYTIIPEIENIPFFALSPLSDQVEFTDNNNNIYIRDFCIQPDGVHPDLEVVIMPIVPARPGFIAVYKIVYRNKGNQTMSQQYGVNFFYNQHLMQHVSSSVAPSQSGPGGASWDYIDLKPFENREILVIMNVNAPTDTNPVNIDDILTFTAAIMPQVNDETVVDNIFVFDQIVMGAYDPNDITCLQGDVVAPEYIGEYLHYLIRFENTGTAEAVNVVVENEIDVTEFDLESLQLLNTSHRVRAGIEGNILKFFFEDINLETGGHGNILLKMRSKNNLQIGDMVKNQANIFFDYNYPIITNEAETVFQTLSTGEVILDATKVTIYPNPANDYVEVVTKDIMESIAIYDVMGRLVQTIVTQNSEVKIPISHYESGTYFLKIKTANGIKVEKLIKK